ncbi:MAG: putative lipid II flippase FtsW [Actinomycetota bacterium]
MTAIRPGRSNRRAGRRSPINQRSNRHWLAPLRTPSVVPGRRTVEFAALLVLTLVLTFIGLMMVLSASSVTGMDNAGSPWFYLQRQGMWAAIGLFAMFVVMRLDYRDLARLSPVFLLITGALLVIVLLPMVGTQVNGARRWLQFGPFTIQPSEFAKLGLTLFAADLIARRANVVHDNRQVLAPVLALALGMALLVLMQPSQGTATIIVAIAMILLFLGGVSIWSLGTVTIGLTGAFVALAVLTPYRRARLNVWGDPFSDPDGAGYQTVQSLVGIASGGLDGVGLGEGRAKWGFLPFAHTDFIFTVVAEELGFVGSVALVAFFVMLVGFGLRIAFRAPDRLGMLLAAGITTAIAMQAFINIGAAINALPISGVTLPFVSMGGSSLVVNLAAMGVVLNIARHTER